MKTMNPKESNLVPVRPLILHHCGHEQCKPSHSFGPAIRPHYLIHFILHGHGTYYVNGAAYQIKAGEGFLIHPGVTTIYTASEEDPWEYCWIGFDGYDVNTILLNCGMSQSSLILKDYSRGMLWDDLLSLVHIFTERQGNEFTYMSLLYRCFSHMCIPSDPSTRTVYENPISKAMDYIHNNYTYDIRITDLAKFMCIDRTYLYKLFMANVTISPQQYLIHHRLKVAKQLLQETELSMTEIAYSCGFRDASSFHKHFKKQIHITPLNYRSLIDKKKDTAL